MVLNNVLTPPFSVKKRTSPIDLSERKLLLRFGDSIVIIFSLWVASSFFNFGYVDFKNTEIFFWISTLLAYLLLLGTIFELYDLKVSNSSFLVIRSIVITTFITTLVYVFTPIIAPSLPENRIQILYFFLIITLPVIIWRIIYLSVLFSPNFFKTVIVIGDSSKVKKIISLIEKKGFYNIAAYSSEKIIESTEGFIDVNSIPLSTLVDEKNASEIIVSTEGFTKEVIENLNKKLIFQFEKGINIKSFESFYEELTDCVPTEHLGYNFYKDIHFSKSNEKGLYLFLHRFIDLLIAMVGIVFLIGILPFILIGNLLGNRGPLFYVQKRVGLHGKIFQIIKLRSMVLDAEKGGAVWAKKNDIRITRFGKFLRNTRLDEIPQFLNILKGEMSLIGPRPERPEFVNNLKEKIPFYSIRNVIKPGLTGWAQVNYPYAATIEEQEKKLRYDLFYIKEQSAFIDFKIIIKTMTTVLFFKGQ